MTIPTELYQQAVLHWPAAGRHILAHEQDDAVVVYQAFRAATAAYAVAHQAFGGDTYSYGRMSWIKPNFLWMMYRCGWAEKEGQKRVLAITIGCDHFETILNEAVHAVYDHSYGDRASWQLQLKEKDVRLQWDPDHDPFGHKCTRRAIQLGLKGEMLQLFGRSWIRKIEDITDFVQEQKSKLDKNGPEALQVPVERVLYIGDPEIRKRIQLDEHHTEPDHLFKIIK